MRLWVSGGVDLQRLLTTKGTKVHEGDQEKLGPQKARSHGAEFAEIAETILLGSGVSSAGDT